MIDELFQVFGKVLAVLSAVSKAPRRVKLSSGEGLRDGALPEYSTKTCGPQSVSHIGGLGKITGQCSE